MSWHRALFASTRRGALSCPRSIDTVPFLAIPLARHASTSNRPAGPPKTGNSRAAAPAAFKHALRDVAVPGPTRPSPRRPEIPRSGSRRATAASKPAQDEWKWSKSKEQEDGWHIEDRIVYARPNEILGGKKINQFKWAYFFAFVMIVQVLSWPDMNKVEAVRAERQAWAAAAKERGMTEAEIAAEQAALAAEDPRNGPYERIYRMFDNITVSRSAIVLSVGASLFFVHGIVKNNVTHIRQIRRTPVPFAGMPAGREVQHRIRIMTSMRDVEMPFVSGVEEFEQKDTGMSMSARGSSILGFRSGNKTSWRVDMTRTKKLESLLNQKDAVGPDVVVSMKRIEQVWELEEAVVKRALWAPITDWFERQAAKKKADEQDLK